MQIFKDVVYDLGLDAIGFLKGLKEGFDFIEVAEESFEEKVVSVIDSMEVIDLRMLHEVAFDRVFIFCSYSEECMDFGVVSKH